MKDRTQRVAARLQAGAAHGAVIAFSATAAYLIAKLLHLEEAYWAPISAAVVLQAEIKATESAAGKRLVGTLLGRAIGWGCGTVWNFHLAWYVAAILLGVVCCYAVRAADAGRICVVTITLVCLIPHQGPLFRVALHRAGEVTLGILVALAFAWIMDRITLKWFGRVG